MFYTIENKLIRKYDNEILCIEPWGKNSFRVRSTPHGDLPEYENALTEKIESSEVNIKIFREIVSVQCLSECL